MSRIETIGDATLYLGDCREILPTLGKVDAVVTDPPYGILGITGDAVKGRQKPKWTNWDADRAWDAQISDALPMALAASSQAIVWGGHLYGLPPMRGWLIWDKKQTDRFSSGSAELAWTTLDQPIRTFPLSQVEAYCEPHARTKEHPTQKPNQLMTWCLGFLPDARTILDPFMGSGTTGVAAVSLGRKFIGIEIEPKYFDIACRRISEEVARPRLPLAEPAPHMQVDFDL